MHRPKHDKHKTSKKRSNDATRDNASKAVRHKKLKIPDMLCCQCGSTIPSNPSGMCVQCLRQQVDITKGIPTETVLYCCRGCERYLGGPTNWMDADRESRQLLAVCLKKIPALRKKVKLVDADFIWTEPHSKRIKVKVTIQKEVFKVIMQQILVVTYVVTNQTCDECTKQVSNQQWSAVVQVRQKVLHKRTMLYLEQLILKHDAHRHTTGIQTVYGATLGGGLDFFFRERSHAKSLISFIHSCVPMRNSQARQLATHDSHSNNYSFKYTFLVEIVPICKHDFVVMPQKLAASLGSMSNAALVTSVQNVIHVVDPISLKIGSIDREKFFKSNTGTPFRALLNRNRMIEFTIIDAELARGARAAEASTNSRGKYLLADVVVARSCDLGKNDVQFHMSTHLGKHLKAGDTCLGYDLTGAIFNDSDTTHMRGKMPDIVLVRKTFPMWRKRNKCRTWKLQRMPQVESSRPNAIAHNESKADYESFLQDLEEDKEMRKKINLFKAPAPEKKSQKVRGGNSVEWQAEDLDAEGEEVEEDFPEVDLDELLDELTISTKTAEPKGTLGWDNSRRTEAPLPSASINVPTPQYGAEDAMNSTSA